MSSVFGDNLKKIRQDKKLTVFTLAAMTGFSRRSIYDWEAGKYVPSSFETRKILANVFHVSPFFFDTDEKEKLENNPVIIKIIKRLEALEKKE